ncbi:MAG: PIN domain-containing protein [Gammaproteobacteria bacterium]|jgi:toxin-antitoxin system PIN domain toxin
MIAVDTGILVYAHRGETELHAAAKDALQALCEGDEPWALPIFCVTEFFRVVTHRRVFNPPSSVKAADDFLAAVRQAPSCRIALPGNGYLDQLRAVLARSHARGNLLFNAQIAALCREHGIRSVLTDDRDFERFPDLELTYLSP